MRQTYLVLTLAFIGLTIGTYGYAQTAAPGTRPHATAGGTIYTAGGTTSQSTVRMVPGTTAPVYVPGPTTAPAPSNPAYRPSNTPTYTPANNPVYAPSQTNRQTPGNRPTRVNAPTPVYAPTPSYRQATVYAPAPAYAPAPVYVPAPVYAPTPVYAPAPVIYAPAPAYAPTQVVYEPAHTVYREGEEHHEHEWEERHHEAERAADRDHQVAAMQRQEAYRGQEPYRAGEHRAGERAGDTQKVQTQSYAGHARTEETRAAQANNRDRN